MIIVSQILPVILELVASLQKKKTLMMLFYTIQSVTYVIMYIVFRETSAMVLSVVASVILFCYFIFELKNVKANFICLIIFEIAYILGWLLSFENALSLLPLFALLIFCYSGWQSNTLILRIGYVLGSILNIIYMLIIGAYIAVIVDVTCFAGNLFGLIFYNLLKKDENSFKFFKKNKCFDDK